jgi:DNA replication protein DnaD
MKTLTNDEQRVYDYLVKMNRKERNDLYFKWVADGTKLTVSQVIKIVKELHEKEYINYSIENISPNKIYHYYTIPTITVNADDFIAEVESDIIYAAVDDEDALVEYKKYVGWLINQYNLEYQSLIKSRLSDYVANRKWIEKLYQTTDEVIIIERILMEAESNSKKNLLHRINGAYPNRFASRVTKETAHKILHQYYQRTAVELTGILDEVFAKQVVSAVA